MESYLIIVAFNLVLFFRTLRYELAVDDNRAWKQAQDSKEWKKETISGKLRILAYLFYGAGFFKNHEKDHLLTISLTIILSCLLYSCFGNIWLSLIWSAHPLNNQVTIWLNGRRYLISMIFALLAYKFIPLGIVLYPIALWFHPVSAAIILIALMKSKAAFWWGITGMLILPRYRHWIKCRWSFQDLKEYKEFNIGKLSLAIRCIAEYWTYYLFPTGFTMYHPRIWGIAELEANKKRNYAFNWPLLGFLCIIVASLVIGWIVGSSCFLWAVMANLSVIQWSGFYQNITQLWAQRYASLFSVFSTLFFLEVINLAPIDFQLTLKCSFLFWCAAITLKDMGMYRNFYTFFLHHSIMYPFNQNVAYFSSVGLNNQAVFFFKEKNKMQALMCDAFSCTAAFLWVIHNKTPDLIHEFLKQKMDGRVNVRVIGNTEEKK